MNIQSANKKFLSYILIVVSLFILIFFVQWQYSSYKNNLELRDEKKILLNQKDQKLWSFQALKNKLNTVNNNLAQYNAYEDDASLLEYFYENIEQMNKAQSIIRIKSIHFSDEIKNDLWFLEKTISINISISNEEALTDFLTFIGDKKSKYAFFIETFSYPSHLWNGPLHLEIPVKIFYK